MLRPARREQNGDEGESHADEVVDERRVGTHVQVECRFRRRQRRL